MAEDTGRRRVGDEQRAAAAKRVSAALADGLIDKADSDRRLGMIESARSGIDLSRATHDLPELGSVKRNARPMREKWLILFTFSWLLVGLWTVMSFFSGSVQYFWPMLAIGPWALILLLEQQTRNRS